MATRAIRQAAAMRDERAQRLDMLRRETDAIRKRFASASNAKSLNRHNRQRLIDAAAGRDPWTLRHTVIGGWSAAYDTAYAARAMQRRLRTNGVADDQIALSSIGKDWQVSARCTRHQWDTSYAEADMDANTRAIAGAAKAKVARSARTVVKVVVVNGEPQPSPAKPERAHHRCVLCDAAVPPSRMTLILDSAKRVGICQALLCLQRYNHMTLDERIALHQSL